jgi:hypothetical protein
VGRAAKEDQMSSTAALVGLHLPFVAVAAWLYGQLLTLDRSGDGQVDYQAAADHVSRWNALAGAYGVTIALVTAAIVFG